MYIAYCDSKRSFLFSTPIFSNQIIQQANIRSISFGLNIVYIAKNVLLGIVAFVALKILIKRMWILIAILALPLKLLLRKKLHRPTQYTDLSIYHQRGWMRRHFGNEWMHFAYCGLKGLPFSQLQYIPAEKYNLPTSGYFFVSKELLC